LIFVSHDRYFVERLATKIIEVGNGAALVYPGTYKEFLWHKAHPDGQDSQEGQDRRDGRIKRVGPGGRAEKAAATKNSHSHATAAATTPSREERKHAEAEARKQSREHRARQQRIDQLEARIAECEAAIREIESKMSSPGFYEDRTAAQPVIDEHQSLMWKVGDLMHQWEMLQTADR
jgi:ATP-binding cassette, subfamily F, member 3